MPQPQNAGLSGLNLADQCVISLCPQPHLFVFFWEPLSMMRQTQRQIYKVPKEVFARTDPSFLGHTPRPPVKVQYSFVTRGIQASSTK